MGERVGGSDSCQRHRCGDRLIELAGIAEGADEAVVSLSVRGSGCDGGAKRISGFKGRAGGKQD